MKSAQSVAQVRAAVHELSRPLGFVPTMGALHAGHLALVERARARCASVVASIFINPMQFGPLEDLAKYPRDLESDREMLGAGGVDLVFAPDASQMYGSGFTTFVDVEGLSARYEGVRRPGHFRGVTTVIAKLLNIVRPDVLFLGQKDAQQAVITRTMLADLNFPVELEIVPTVREPDGLAMSSRNGYLNERERAQAPSLYRALCAARDELGRGRPKPAALETAAARLASDAVLEYLDVVDARTFVPIEELAPPAFVIGAARFGTTRLIDNLWVRG